MAIIEGYVTLPTDSYDAWKNAVNGNGYNVDYQYGCQCWDLASEFWYNVGFPTGYPTTAGTHSAYGVWDDREQNAGDQFDLIYNMREIKRGDIIVFNRFASNPDGHIGFADEDFVDTNSINILSQNNGGVPTPSGGTTTNVNDYDLQYFRGAFRYRAWVTPPTPTEQKHKFPFVLYARRLRQKRLGL